MFFVDVNCHHRFQMRLGIFFSFGLGARRFRGLVVKVFIRRLGLYRICLCLILMNFLVEFLLFDAVRSRNNFVKLFVDLIFFFFYHFHILLDIIHVFSLNSKLSIFNDLNTFLFHLIGDTIFSHFKKSSFVCKTIFFITFFAILIVKLLNLNISIFIFEFSILLILQILKAEKYGFDVNRWSQRHRQNALQCWFLFLFKFLMQNIVSSRFYLVLRRRRQATFWWSFNINQVFRLFTVHNFWIFDNILLFNKVSAAEVSMIGNFHAVINLIWLGGLWILNNGSVVAHRRFRENSSHANSKIYFFNFLIVQFKSFIIFKLRFFCLSCLSSFHFSLINIEIALLCFCILIFTIFTIFYFYNIFHLLYLRTALKVEIILFLKFWSVLFFVKFWVELV